MDKKHHRAIIFRGKKGKENIGIIFHTSLGKKPKLIFKKHTIYKK